MFGARPDLSGMLRSELRPTVGRDCCFSDRPTRSQPNFRLLEVSYTRVQPAMTLNLCLGTFGGISNVSCLDFEPGHGLKQTWETCRSSVGTFLRRPWYEVRRHAVVPSCNAG